MFSIKIVISSWYLVESCFLEQHDDSLYTGISMLFHFKQIIVHGANSNCTLCKGVKVMNILIRKKISVAHYAASKPSNIFLSCTKNQNLLKTRPDVSFWKGRSCFAISVSAASIMDYI